jgi:hypothetical protein
MGALKVSLFEADPAGFHTEVLRSLGTMSANDRTIARGQGRRLLAIAHERHHGISLWSLRKEDLSLHADGNIRPWDLPEDVAEGGYFQFHAHGIVAMLAPGHAPRTTSLGLYLLDKFDTNVAFNPVVRTNRGAHVASFDEIKRIEFNLTGEALPVLREVDASLARAISSMFNASDATKLKIALDGTDSDSRGSLWAKTRSSMRKLADRDDLYRLKGLKVVVPAELDGEETVDLLKDKVGYQVDGPDGRVAEDSAFRATARAYSRFREEFGG